MDKAIESLKEKATAAIRTVAQHFGKDGNLTQDELVEKGCLLSHVHKAYVVIERDAHMVDDVSELAFMSNYIDISLDVLSGTSAEHMSSVDAITSMIMLGMVRARRRYNAVSSAPTR